MNYLWRRIGNSKSSSQSSSDKNATQNRPARDELVLFGNLAKRFDWEDVKRANWKVLGEGKVGTTYKVDLEDGITTVVVKRLKDVVFSAEDFRDAVEALEAMDHENLLPLRGYLYSKDQKLLLYDYMPLGSLSSQLRNTPLSWEVRLSIALGASRAIEHLHYQRCPNNHHGNIKPSNVLLTQSYEARVSDYGLGPLTRSSLAGGPDPTMADVRSFGVLLLELLTGKLPTHPHIGEGGVDLRAWVQSVAREEWTADVFDMKLRRYHDVEEGMVELLEVAISCVSLNSNECPRMSELRRKIEELCCPGMQQDGNSQSDKVSEGTNHTSSWLIPGAQEDGDSQLGQFSEGTKGTSSWFIPSAQEDGDSQLDQFSEWTKDTSSWLIPSAQEDRDSQLDQFSERTKDTSSWLIPSAQEDRDSQLDQFSELSNDIYTRTPPDRVVEVSERVYVSVDSSSDEEQPEIQIAKRDQKIEAQDLQFEDQAVYSALPSQDANISDEENELREWPIQSNTGLPTSILFPMLSTQSQASVNSAHDGSTTFSDSASSLLSPDGSPVNFSATLTKKNIKRFKTLQSQASVNSAHYGSTTFSDSASSLPTPDGSPVSFSAKLTKKNIKTLQSPEQQLISSLELHQDVACVSVDSLQVEDQAVYNWLLSQDANTSYEENELREWPIQSNTTFPTSTLLLTLSSQSEVPVYSTLDESIASSDSASSSLCQDRSPVSFGAMLTKKNIEPLQSPKEQLFPALELSQDVHSGESIQFRGWKEGIAAVTAINFDITCGRECASSSAVSSDSIEATEDLILSRLSSSNSMSSGFHYDVFLSFRGPDTRSGIMDFLYTSLVAAGINTYRDDDELRIGEEIGPELLKAIDHSKISIPLFSKGYAFSKWCLNELVQMVECKKSRRQKIMPIFYDVTPSEVRNQTGSYEDAFVLHEKQFDIKVISKWKAALKEVGNLKGWDIDSMTTRREGELVNHIVQKVIAELKKAYLLVTDCLVGVEYHVKEIKRMVCSDSEDIQILGIHGMGGVGKTTLAKIIYNHLSYRFEECCFISNVRETSRLKGIVCLQNQLISDILKRNWLNISNVDDGIKKIKERLCGKKVLVLLDDVDERIHLNALMGRPVWFGKGSRIIITSRNMDVFNVPEVCCTYELTGMDFNQSLQLFCKHAFGRDHPLGEYVAFSSKVVKMTGGLPLALEVIGSQLRGKSKEYWDVTLEKLEKVPHEEVKKKLKICYDALDYRQKQIFLDIARSYIGFDKRAVLPLWPSDLFPGEGLLVLQQRSLIKVGEDNKLWMHVQLRDLARDIIREEGKMKLENGPDKGIMRKLHTFS